MNIKIGFVAEENEAKTTATKTPETHAKAKTAARRSLVEVYFPDRHFSCTYYNDVFDLKRGDAVFVEGKLEGLLGRVTSVNYSFKIKLSDYKRIISVAETEVLGEFHMAGSHFITLDPKALPYRQARTWFLPPVNEEDETASSNGGESFFLGDLGGMKIREETADRGHELYTENRVVYIEINNGRGRAVVIGSRPYELEFGYNNREISDLVCSCYCAGNCKHEFAAMLQLRETLRIIEEEYNDEFYPDYLAAVSKLSFFDYAIEHKTHGTVSFE
ncbi:MAG: hypothetical protein IJ426_07400 [Clostridia bacterium]|nr:hypothetical protein [Clostridia bacterium]